MTTLSIQILEALKQKGDPVRAAHSQRFFKTGEGEYGEGDVFLGIKVPVQRALARRFKQATLSDALALLKSEYHEARLTALFLLINIYSKAEPETQGRIYQSYLDHVDYVNNWDLVDSSAMQIVGHFLQDKDRSPLRMLAKSPVLWERRIAIIASFHYIKHYDFQDTLDISKILLSDSEDLIHKGVGWMLREVGNKSRAVEEAFLLQHYRQMPRTMLRYAIEKFPEARRQAFLKGEL